MLRNLILAICLATLFSFSQVNADSTINIDFNDTGAPSTFTATVALTDLYSGLGINFEGPAPMDGGGILNESSGFGIGARSGTDFFAFNPNANYSDGGIARDPETINFDFLATSVSIWAADGFDLATFLIEGFRDGQLITSNIINTMPGDDWAELSISSPDGFDSVVLTNTGSSIGWVYDDLSVEVVPEPSSTAWLGVCLIGAWMRRRRT